MDFAWTILLYNTIFDFQFVNRVCFHFFLLFIVDKIDTKRKKYNIKEVKSIQILLKNSFVEKFKTFFFQLDYISEPLN